MVCNVQLVVFVHQLRIVALGYQYDPLYQITRLCLW
jgi:hypothetical protein